MKKTIFAVFVAVFTIGLSACGSNGGKTEKTSASTTEQSTKASTEDSSEKLEKSMEEMKTDLDEKGVSIEYNEYGDYWVFTREKSIDYDYFMMRFTFNENEVYKVGLELKGNIDGETKDTLYYMVNKGRMTESSIDNTDINALAEVLESIDYSDQEMLEFAQWCYDNK